MIGLARKKTPLDLRIVDWVATSVSATACVAVLYGLKNHWPQGLVNWIVSIGLSVAVARAIFTLVRPTGWLERLAYPPWWFAGLAAAFMALCWFMVLSKPVS
jgi:hypothetical protein